MNYLSAIFNSWITYVIVTLFNIVGIRYSIRIILKKEIRLTILMEELEARREKIDPKKAQKLLIEEKKPVKIPKLIIAVWLISTVGILVGGRIINIDKNYEFYFSIFNWICFFIMALVGADKGERNVKGVGLVIAVFYILECFLSIKWGEKFWYILIDQEHSNLITILACLAGIFITIISVSPNKRSRGIKGAIVATVFLVACGVIFYARYQPEVIEEVEVLPVLSGDISVMIDFSPHRTNESQDMVEADVERTIKILDLQLEYINYLQKYVDGEIVYPNYRDYEGDGQSEMFAIVVEDISSYDKNIEESKYGTIWYVDQYGVIEIESQAREYMGSPKLVLSDGKLIIIFEECSKSGNVLYIWGVMDHQPYRSEVSGKGSDWRINEYEEMEITALRTSVMPDKDSIGQTYYFYIEDTLKEYGGLKISIEDLFNFADGGKYVAEIYNEGCQIESIYYRQNGIININICREDDGTKQFYNIALRYDGTNLNLVQSKEGNDYSEGICLEALSPEIATYPEDFPN